MLDGVWVVSGNADGVNPNNRGGDRVVIDVAQNTVGPGGRVRGHAALFHGEDDAKVRWVVMPVNLGLEPGPESLGSNHREQDQAA